MGSATGASAISCSFSPLTSHIHSMGFLHKTFLEMVIRQLLKVYAPFFQFYFWSKYFLVCCYVVMFHSYTDYVTYARMKLYLVQGVSYAPIDCSLTYSSRHNSDLAGCGQLAYAWVWRSYKFTIIFCVYFRSH